MIFIFQTHKVFKYEFYLFIKWKKYIISNMILILSRETNMFIHLVEFLASCMYFILTWTSEIYPRSSSQYVTILDFELYLALESVRLTSM